jgi:uncharacterized membrane protein
MGPQSGAGREARVTPPPAPVVSPRAVRRWLGPGLRDFAAMPLASLLYGFMFVAIAFVLEACMRDGAWMLAFVTGFTLVAPFLAIRLYALSRDRCRDGTSAEPVALFFDQPASSLAEPAAGLSQDPEGLMFFAVHVLVGGGFAWLVFATGISALPMMLDRPVDVLSAMI